MGKTMNLQNQLSRLKAISDLVRDQHLTKLQVCAAARTASLQRLDDLRVTQNGDLDPILQAQSMVRYQHWADLRRAEINLVLARQTVDWMEARGAAQSAFGRAEVLRQLQIKHKRRA